MEDTPRGLVPVPDPTILTTAQALRIEEALRREFEQRFRENNRAIELLQSAFDRAPPALLIQEQVRHLQELHESKFESIKKQFADSDVALIRALDGATALVNERDRGNKAAIDKSEAAIIKLIDATQVRIDTATTTSSERYDDIRIRLTAIENRAVGMVTQKQDSKDSWGFIFGAFGMLVGLVGAIGVFASIAMK